MSVEAVRKSGVQKILSENQGIRPYTQVIYAIPYTYVEIHF